MYNVPSYQVKQDCERLQFPSHQQQGSLCSFLCIHKYYDVETNMASMGLLCFTDKTYRLC